LSGGGCGYRRPRCNQDGGFQPAPTRPTDGMKQHAKCGRAT